jgi:hypothetical protein
VSGGGTGEEKIVGEQFSWLLRADAFYQGNILR